MKKYIALVLAVLMALTSLVLVGCGECDHTYLKGVCVSCGVTDPNYTNLHKHIFDDNHVCTSCGAFDPNYVHEHSFVEGVCTGCGAFDPNYQHQHSYQEGVCTGCGLTDPNYQHQHSFVEGVCTECGAMDPNFQHVHKYQDGQCVECNAWDPNFQHIHKFANGTCTVCGATDPSYVAPHTHNFVDGACTICGLPAAGGNTPSQPDQPSQPEQPSHVCESVCPQCGKCLDATCTESACADKCQGHHVHNFVEGKCECGETDPDYVPPHVCESVCEQCGKCLDAACTETACEEKCPGHHVHNFVEGKCECGEEDPNYVPPATIDSTIANPALKLTNTGKIYLTSIGQANFATLKTFFKTMLKMTEGTDFISNEFLTASEVTGNDILFIMVGGSTKGLGGASGHTVASEVARAEAFAKVSGLEIVVIHVGAESYRGTTSDPLIEAAVPGAKVTMFVTGANTDGLFTKLAKPGSLFEYTTSGKMLNSLKFLLGK